MTQRLYTEMSADEQAQWVQDFAQVIEQGDGRLSLLAKGKIPTTVPAGSPAGLSTTTDDAALVRRAFDLLSAWPFAQDFCEKARRYGDYMARTSRLPIYIEKVKEKLAEGLTMTDAQGRVVAYVNPSTPMRRRGRPTKEEVAARLRGGLVAPVPSGSAPVPCGSAPVPCGSPQGSSPVPAGSPAGKAIDPETRKRRTIAALLGLQVVVTGDAPREKNNAELKAERDARVAEDAKRNPSLFGDTVQPVAVPQQQAEQPSVSTPVPSGSPAGSAAVPSPCAQLMSDSYEMRMAQDKLHLDQLAWLCSKPLQERIKLVQGQRTTSESASERAKLLAEMNGSQQEIAEYAEQAKVATESYLQTYADIDDELAILHKRLYLDLPFVEKFKQRFKGVDIEKIQYITRPYYEKVRKADAGIDLRIRTLIEQENPEYAARMKAEEEKKQEVADLLRYLKRKDKPNVRQRIETMEKRYARLIELLGEDEARVYRPIVDAAIEDYNANFKAKDEEKAAAKRAPAEPAPAEKKAPAAPVPDGSAVGKKSAKQESKKAASRREQEDAGISTAEPMEQREQSCSHELPSRDRGGRSQREQARRDNGKTTKKETKKPNKED